MKSSECPYCEESITLPGKIHIGKQIRCSFCGEFIEVIATDPVEVDYLFQYEEDDYIRYKFDEED